MGHSKYYYEGGGRDRMVQHAPGRYATDLVNLSPFLSVQVATVATGKYHAAAATRGGGVYAWGSILLCGGTHWVCVLCVCVCVWRWRWRREWVALGKGFWREREDRLLCDGVPGTPLGMLLERCHHHHRRRVSFIPSLHMSTP